MPSQCGKPLVFRVVVDSYLHPGRLDPSGTPDLSDPNWKVTTVTDPPLEGCEKLQTFTPYLTVSSDTSFADTPSGTTVELSVPQGEGLVSGSVLATPTIQDTTVTLPQGMAISPGQANGLAACQFSEDAIGTTGTPSCPAASKVGTVEIATPLLPDKLEGAVYVMQSTPLNLKLLVAASADDVNVKLLGDVKLDLVTGQITSTFAGTPQLPFTHFKLAFSGGAQAALSTPPSCGVYASSADFTPWSSPATPDFRSANAFGLQSGPNGTACSSPLPFTPSMIAGATTDQAGGLYELLAAPVPRRRSTAHRWTTVQDPRGTPRDAQQCSPLRRTTGGRREHARRRRRSGIPSSAPLEDQLNIPQAGQPPAPIYLTGPYRGAPFGLSIVVPVVAGPFNLGTVVVRASINVDPDTSRLTISTDAFPSILDGIPADLRQINAVIDRPNFMFNPTSCAPTEFSGTAQSTGRNDRSDLKPLPNGVLSIFEVQSELQSRNHRQDITINGVSLDVKIVYPTGPLGANQASSQSNIKSVGKVDLPKQLPSRLLTLQKACLAAQFNANPAGCPAGSVIGHAKAITPVLPVPVEGPVYFVSHGGEVFPSLVMVLEGDGVKVDLTASTFISKAGITSSTFHNIPDVPISSFELYLPQGKNSALAATGNLCNSKLLMPTAFTGQNGAEIHEKTTITVTGCAKQKTVVSKNKKAKKSSHAKGRK